MMVGEHSKGEQSLLPRVMQVSSQAGLSIVKTCEWCKLLASSKALRHVLFNTVDLELFTFLSV